MQIQQMINKLAQSLSKKRLEHSLGVSKTAGKLARRYGCDPVKAQIAGLLHDCARELTRDRLLSTADAFDIVVGDIERCQTVLLHAPIGAKLAEAEYGVSDVEISRAIALHTTGAANMSVLDKIIFLADVIEPNRSFRAVKAIRSLAAEDLDKAMLAAYDQSLALLVAGHALIHPDTIAGRNELLMSGKASI